MPTNTKSAISKMPKIPKIAAYTKNVGKSVAFASINAVKENMPGLKGFAEDNHDVFVSAYSGLKDIKGVLKRSEKSIKDSNLYKAIEYGAKNMIEDAKTGNFYNDRTDEISEEAMGLNDTFDFNFDYEVSNNSGSSSNASKQITDTFNSALKESTIGTTTAVARGTDMVVRSTRASTTILSSQIEKSTATLHSGLGAVYNSIGAVNTFLNGPMLAHLNNSKTYYENSLKIMQEEQAMLKELLEMQRNLYVPQMKKANESAFDQSFNYNGYMDLKGYSKVVKKNIESALGPLTMMSGTGINMPLMIAAAPFKYILDGLMQGMMPKNLQKSLNTLDKSFAGLFGQFIGKMNKNKNNYGNDFLRMLGNIFGISIEDKKTIDTSNYNKGAVPFDGITRKTIIEVIPGYLARIEAALTGAGERHYNARSGKWVSAKQMEADWKKERIDAIEASNRGITNDIRASGLDSKTMKIIEASVRQMKEVIFEDGYFDPKIVKNENGKRTSSKTGDAYKKYGFKSKEQFDAVLSMLSDDTLLSLAASNMRGKQNYSRKVKQYEEDGGYLNNLFNGAYGENDKKTGHASPSKYTAGTGLLALSYDKEGHNVFYYLKEILHTIDRRKNNRGNKKNNKNNYSASNTTNKSGINREASTKSESEDDSGSDDDDSDSAAWEQVSYERDELEKKKAEEEAKKKAARKWVDDKVSKSPVGKFFDKVMGNVSGIISMPMKYATDLLEKANASLFRLMFGDNMEVDGKKVNSVFEYITLTIKKSFEDLKKKATDYLKETFKEPMEWIKKNIVDKYVKPVWAEVKNVGRAAGRRVGKGLKNTFGKAAGTVVDNLPPELAAKIVNGGVVSADEVESSMAEEEFENNYAYDVEGVDASARGRVVRKRGLTMISPGEVIIPASFNRRKQNIMLAAEKRDRSRIMNAIGLNAAGSANSEDVERLKKQLEAIYNENRGSNKGAKISAGGVIGGGLGLLGFGNPILGALAGAGVAILNNSATMQKMVFGEDIVDENGNVVDHKGGIISKKIQDTFKKYGSDMTDYGIAGGVLGLLSPFGVLGGAAIGAGVGFLKNNESFKKFIFGENGDGKDGLMSKETFEKFKGHVKKAAPKMALGAGLGILAGPFGLLGNAAMGAGVGLLTETETFHKFLYGDGEDKNGGLIGAFKTGFLDPAKDKFLEFVDDFKKFAQKNILEPMKNFWKPVTQMIKNTVVGITEKIADHINDGFEKWVGLPLHDFLQEKVFRPMAKIIGGVAKLPYTLAKGVIAAPMRLIGGVGNTVRARQIRRGTAYDMSASERLAFRDQHKVRFNSLNSWRDKTRDEDEFYAALSADGQYDILEQLASMSRAGLTSKAELQRNVKNARTGISNDISKYFNASGSKEEVNRFNRAGYPNVNKLTEIAQTQGFDAASEFIDKKMGNLTPKEKKEIKDIIKAKIDDVNIANEAMNLGNMATSQLEKELSKITGRKVKGRSGMRRIMKSAEAELKNRKKAEESPEVNATNNFAEIYQKRTTDILNAFTKTNEILSTLAGLGKNDTMSASMKADKAAKEASGEDSENKTIDEHKNKANEKIKETVRDINKKSPAPVTKTMNPTTGQTEIPANVDPDSKEAVEIRKKNEESENRFKVFFKNNEKSASTLEEIKNALLGKNKDKDKKEGWLSKLWGGLKKAGKFIGIAGLALTGVSLFGYATEWFKTSVWPTMKTALFGTKDSDGNIIKEGLVGKLKTALVGQDGYSGILGGLRRILFGRKNEDGEVEEYGLIGKALHGIKRILFGEKDENGDWARRGLLSPVIDIFNGVKDYITGKGGIKAFFLEDLIPKFLGGIKLAIDNVGAPLFAILFKSLPGLIGSLAKAILEGLKISIFKKTLKKGGKPVKFDDGGASDAINSALKSSNSASASVMGSDLYNKTKGAMESFFNSTSGSSAGGSGASAANTDIDINSIFGEYENENEKQSLGVGGLLGKKERTNELVYDEEGNIVSDYIQNNTVDSAGSKIWDATKRGFVNGLVGIRGVKTAGKAIKNTATSAGKVFMNLATPGFGSKIKAVGNGIKTAFNGAKSVVSSGTNLGAGLNKVLVGKAAGNVAEETVEGAVKNSADNLVEGVLKKATKEAAENVAENAAKDGIKSGLKGIFKNIAESGLAKKIAKFVSKDTTEAVVKKAIEKIGTKLGDNIVGKAAKGVLSKIGGAISKFSPAAILLLIYDFWKGYDNAYTILGVAKIEEGYNVSFGQKCVCGFLNLISENLTLGLISPELIVDICVDALFPAFGLDASSLSKARASADEAMEKWNLEHPDETYDNLEDFNNRDKFTTKAKNYLKNVFGIGKKKETTGGGSSVNSSGHGGGGGTIPNSGSGRNALVGLGRRLYGLGSITPAQQVKLDYANKQLDKWNRTHIDETYDNLKNFSRSTGTANAVMKKLMDANKGIITGSVKATKNLSKTVSKNLTMMLKGDTSGLNTTISNDSSIDSLSSYTANNALDIVKLYTNPVASLVSSFMTINKEFKTMFNKRSATKTTSRSDNTKITNAMNGKTDVMSTSTYWTTASQSKNGILGYMEEMNTNIEKIITAPISIIKRVNDKIKSSLTAVKTQFGSQFKTIWDWIQSFFTTAKGGTSTSSRTSTAGRGRLFGKAHNYQGDMANIPYGDSTIGEAGCGPVAAANLLGGSVMDAANYAESRGMTVPGGGTDMRFFNSYLGSKGIPTRNTSNRSSVMNALANGNQVIMLGQDNYDVGAPFGTVPHYITAKGIAPNGNIIAEDPDLPYSMIEYDPNQVMNSMVSSVVAGRGRRRLYGKGKEEMALLNKYRVTSSYDEARNGNTHRALDLITAFGEPIYAFTNGTVKNAVKGFGANSGYLGSKDGGGFGNHVTIVDNNGAWHTYAHMGSVSVSAGQSVNRGDVIGTLGNSGSSTGAHLHYQIGQHDLGYGTPRYNPFEYLPTYSSTSGGGSSSGGSSSGGSSSGDYSSGSSDDGSSSSSGSAPKKQSTGNLMTALGNLGKSMVKAIFGEKAFNAIYSDDSSSDGGSSGEAPEGYEDTDGTSSGMIENNGGGSSSGGGGNTGGTMNKTAATTQIWNTLKSMGYSNAGAAGIMGNMNAESAFRSNNMEDSKEGTYNDSTYTAAINNGKYTKSKFIHDAIGYGLPQFTYYTYKQRLYENTVDKGLPIDSIDGQLKTLDGSISSGLRSYMKSATDVDAASDKFLIAYENPANPEATRGKRRQFSWNAYNTFAKNNSSSSVIKPNANKTSAGTGATMVAKGRRNYGAAAQALNVTRSKYYGRGRYVGMGVGQPVDYATFLTTIVEILISISNNTAKLNRVIEILSENFNIKLSEQDVSKESKASSRAEAERHLNDLVRSKANTSEYSRIMNNKDTNYLVAAMSAIASE